MESRLPIFKKGTATAQTATMMKQNCPILTASTAIRLKNVIGISNLESGENFDHLIKGKEKRARSPDTKKRPLMDVNHRKLRRSVSVPDIRLNHHLKSQSNQQCQQQRYPIKRFMPTLTDIPAKITKTNTSVKSVVGQFKGPPTVANTSNKNTNSIKTTSTGGGGAASTKLTGKRIPAYDYKARFLDLQEKHKLIKDKNEHLQQQLEHLDSLPEKYEAIQLEFAEINESYKNATNEIANHIRDRKIESDRNEQEHKKQCLKIQALTTSFNETSQQLKSLKIAHKEVTEECSSMKSELITLRELKNTLTISNERLENDMEKYKTQLYRANIERKELHNTIMDLKGNIRVFCRVRPMIESEEDRHLCGWNYLDEQSLEISSNENYNSTKQKIKHDFSFDHVFHPNSTQDEVFESVSPLIQSAMDGYNVCIFAYGQTGSGKTYTMDGYAGNVGIIPRTVNLIYQSIDNYERLGWTYALRVTFLEIYNEVLYDLLSDNIKDMEIRMVSAKNPTEIYVSNITEVTVQSADKLRELMDIAKINRATAATVSNERSSRSHAVTRIQLIGTHKERNETCIGTINLVDLAGSESPKTSIRMEETKKINKSLSELTNVILALLQKNDHIPYRNSKLTHLLMPSLGGNSKTLMFINVSPFQDCFGESVKSLRFAASVNACKLTKVKKNKFLNTSTASLSSSSINS